MRDDQDIPAGHPAGTEAVPPDRIQYLAAAFLVLAGLGVAWFFADRAVGIAEWPYDPDATRDIAQARVIMQGDYPADYFYKGEWLWYNPGTGAVVAALAWLCGVEPNVAAVQYAPIINLAVPLTFLLLVVRAYGLWPGVAALGAFLFLIDPSRPTWVSSSYSGWLFAPHLAQAWFYLSALCLAAVARNQSWANLAGFGALLGLTFLWHTAPAILLGVMFTLMMIEHALRKSGAGWRTVFRRYSATLLTAFVVSLPFTISILFRYRLHIVNDAPAAWVYEPLLLENLNATLRSLLDWRSILVVAGVVTAASRWKLSPPNRVLLYWGTTALVLLVYSYAAQWAARRDVALLQIAPGYHYLLYVSACAKVLMGIGVYGLAATAVALLSRISTGFSEACAARPNLRRRAFAGATVLLTLVVSGAAFRDYLAWRELQPQADRINVWMSSPGNPYHWLREHASREDVLLCDDTSALYLAAPAGVPVVAGDPLFSNLYLPYKARAQARESMWAAAEAGDTEEFLAAAGAYDVTLVLAIPARNTTFDVDVFDEVFASAYGTIYRIRY